MNMVTDLVLFSMCSVESWLTAQNYCQSINGNLLVLRQWEYLYHINAIAKPWPVYIGVTEVSVM